MVNVYPADWPDSAREALAASHIGYDALLDVLERLIYEQDLSVDHWATQEWVRLIALHHRDVGTKYLMLDGSRKKDPI